MNIVIITSNSIRHNYFKIMFSNNSIINVIRTYVELKKIDIKNLIDLRIKKYDDIGDYEKR